MSMWIYLSQTLLVSVVVLILLRNQHWVLRLQTLIWMSAVSVIALYYGLSEQLRFYSNDQVFYDDIVRNFSRDVQVLDVDWWMSLSRLPYTLPAFVLYSIGISSALALKTVSLICLLWLTNDVLKNVQSRTSSRTLISCLLTACGTIGCFYSVLALRETLMMLLATRFFLTRSPATRLSVIVLLFMLRPHLSVSLAVAAVISAAWRHARGRRPESVLTVSSFVIAGSWIGYWLYSFGNSYLASAIGQFGHTWGIQPVTRIASNFFGVQFLTARSETVEFSLLSLVLLRLILVETVLIPTLFILLVFMKPHRLNEQRTTLLLAFTIYVGLVTNTDFNSFRQNIPFMTSMGLAVLAMLPNRRSMSSSPGTELRPSLPIGDRVGT